MLFKDCTLVQLDELFNLNPVNQLPVLEAWLEGKSDTSAQEHDYLIFLQTSLRDNVDNWNEYELVMHFIGPLFTLVNFHYQHQFSLFGERFFEGIVSGIELSGKPDGMVATGYRQPKKPYFCFQEYKKETDPTGDPAGQAMAAMLVAQEINEGKFPIYGCYVRGRYWRFMALQGQEYALSDSYTATREDIFDIFRILKVLKQIIIERVTQNTL